jgi:hypothetical protein
MTMAEPQSLNIFPLIAPCGMNCGICLAFLREKNKCPGCRAIDLNQPVTRSRCKIKNCPNFKNRQSKFCFACETFPCDRLKHLDKRYRTKYKMSMIENLDHIKKLGIKNFVAAEKVRWACPECGDVICVHKGYCLACGDKIDMINS